MFLLVSFISVLLCIFYILLYIFFIRGWGDLPEFQQSNVVSHSLRFSILIPARNEEANIYNCIQDLILQNYPTDLFELIIIDDHSTDRTAQIVKKVKLLTHGPSIKIIRMGKVPAKGTIAFKKEAINEGISLSTNDWIITTDADCRRGKEWLSTIASFIEEKKPLMVCGPVIYEGGHTIFENAQSLECLGLVAIGAASLQNKFPNMCNGANLAYQKSAFMEVNGYAGTKELASGDDEFLMHKIHTQWPGKVLFLKSNAAVVSTSPIKKLPELMQQRKRWVSKSRKYSFKGITIVLALSYLFNLSIALNLIASIISAEYWILFTACLAAKLLPEYIFLQSVSRFFRKGRLMRFFIPGSLLHVPYVLFIGIYGNFGQYKWKGRTVK